MKRDEAHIFCHAENAPENTQDGINKRKAPSAAHFFQSTISLSFILLQFVVSTPPWQSILIEARLLLPVRLSRKLILIILTAAAKVLGLNVHCGALAVMKIRGGQQACKMQRDWPLELLMTSTAFISGKSPPMNPRCGCNFMIRLFSNIIALQHTKKALPMNCLKGLEQQKTFGEAFINPRERA